MNNPPIIMTGDLLDALASLPDNAVDAVLSLVPVQRAKRLNQFTLDEPLDQHVVDQVAEHLIRVSTGAVALLLVHATEQWHAAFTRAGRHVTQETYSDMIDVIVAHTGPVKLPSANTDVLEPLVSSMIATISKPGDTLLNHCGLPALPSRTIHTSGRNLIAITPNESERRNLNDSIVGVRQHPLTPEQKAEAHRRLAAGESLASVARDVGKRPTGIIRKLRSVLA